MKQTKITNTKHIYDVDIVSIYHSLLNKIESNLSLSKVQKKDFKNRFTEIFLYQARRNGYEKKDLDKLGKSWHIVFTPGKDRDNFIYWYALMLVTYDTSGVRLPLLYHKEKWSNKVKYLNIVEFVIRDIITNMDLIDSKEIVGEINKWLYEMRLKHGYKDSQSSSLANKTAEKDTALPNSNYNDINDDLSQALLFVDSWYQVQLLKYITDRCKNKSDIKLVDKIIKSEGPSKPIPLTINANEIIYVFRYLYEHGKITKPSQQSDLENKIIEWFTCRGNKYQPIKLSYSKKAFRGQADPKAKKIDQIKDHFNIDSK